MPRVEVDVLACGHEHAHGTVEDSGTGRVEAVGGYRVGFHHHDGADAAEPRDERVDPPFVRLRGGCPFAVTVAAAIGDVVGDEDQHRVLPLSAADEAGNVREVLWTVEPAGLRRTGDRVEPAGSVRGLPAVGG